MKYFVIVVALALLMSLNRNAAARSKSKMPAHPIKLYYLPPSPPCRVVMMTAKVLGLELDLILTNIMEGAHLTPEYLKMNPQHSIPTMDDNGFILWESSMNMDTGKWFKSSLQDLMLPTAYIQTFRAIISYLVNAYGRNDTLYPKNPRLRALVDQRLMFDLGTLYLRYITLYGPVLFSGEELDEAMVIKLNEALGWLNIMLEGKAFVAGENMTIADISILTTITNLSAFDYDMSNYENVLNWFTRMKREMAQYDYKEIDEKGAHILASFLKKE